MRSVTAILTSLLVVTGASALSERSLLLHEKRDTHPASFVSHGPAASDAPLRLRIALVQSDIAGLKDKLMEVSTPGNAAYGQHLSKDELFAYTSPKASTVDAVQKWLSENGLESTQASPAGDWITITTTVKQANALLDADFSTFSNSQTGDAVIRTLSYSIPASLKEHVELVHPTVSFPGPRHSLPVASIPLQNLSTNAAPSSCNRAITPTCLQELYNIPTTAAPKSSNQLAVSGFIDQFANQADLKSFLTSFRKDISSSTTFTLQTLDGGSNPQNINEAGVEADLDIEYTVGLATGVPVAFVSVGDNFQDGDLEGFLDIINFLAAESTPPTVLTTSYGQDESTISRALAEKLCNAYASIGTRGTSILFASGDGGVSGSQSQSCSKFIPTFPSGCPFLTSVGATQNVNPEVAAALSAGGFSNYFDTPSYQTSAKAAYLSALGSTNSGKFNASGRGYPDVAAIGEDVEIVSGGQTGLVAGTSCSSPIFASVIALINSDLIAAGKPPLGFLNPWLYSTAASALNDITSGSNPGCNTNGFPAKAGWDPVTGNGSPDFVKLRTAAGL
ncbi:unnamed protein product [Peniophora sp. CBMAI 1063]|nr:unnamed protein product [Peniophora sp. CBMAI 1063]